MTTLTIHQEQAPDLPAVQALLQAAFARVEHSDQTEPLLVAKLRQSPDFIPALSLVAQLEGQVVG